MVLPFFVLSVLQTLSPLRGFMKKVENQDGFGTSNYNVSYWVDSVVSKVARGFCDKKTTDP
jgi:hypothetical protein